MPLMVDVALADGSACVRLAGELDIAAAARLEQAIAHAEQAGPSRLEIDLAELEFIDSTGLRLLLAASRRAADAGCRLVLRRGPSQVQRVFEITAVTRFFEFVD